MFYPWLHELYIDMLTCNLTVFLFVAVTPPRSQSWGGLDLKAGEFVPLT